jgi:hypothetical protein
VVTKKGRLAFPSVKNCQGQLETPKSSSVLRAVSVVPVKAISPRVSVRKKTANLQPFNQPDNSVTAYGRSTTLYMASVLIHKWISGSRQSAQSEPAPTRVLVSYHSCHDNRLKRFVHLLFRGLTMGRRRSGCDVAKLKEEEVTYGNESRLKVPRDLTLLVPPCFK